MSGSAVWSRGGQFIRRRAGEGVQNLASSWDWFWFSPRMPDTLALLRIGTGGMLLYMHLVLATDLMSFLGDHAWIRNETSRQLHDGSFAPADWSRSYLWHLSSPASLWMHHGLVIFVTASFMVGWMTRITAPLAWLMQLMYIHRLTGALFGLDQIVTYATMYLMWAPSGALYSVDAWLRKRFSQRRAGSGFLRWLLPDCSPSLAANVSTRLFQIHLCVIYLFGGLAKARGTSWWDGTALWYAVGNYEYQSIDMTWLGAYPSIFSALTHVTLFWEVFYCALVWPKLTRPFVLAMAVAVHGGIALFMGMATFGSMMILANLIFVEPHAFARLRGIVSKRKPLGTNAWLEQRERRIRKATKKIKSRYTRLKQKEAKFQSRVERLKQREVKVRRFLAKQQKRRSGNSTEHPDHEATD